MNYYDLQKNAFGACEGMKGSLPITNQNGPVICPKPCRVGVLTNMSIRPLRWHFSQQVEESDSKAGAELLDIILKKETYEEEYANQLVSSPPYFFGSPPVRAGNPLINDARFRDEQHTPMSSISSPLCLLSPTSASHKAGCARTKYGPKPAAVRVEGFDCISRDHKNSSIPSVA
ncbi:hypothetical protein TanjilG_27640 [Lupinus angustifolius]|uniref:Uncharacterized protein n=1 Tax=Lupinus angustifolius TaxID=3871 RepID=A0A1J7GYF5_LUPAN|nr:PREDICTED: uncharacterized protein LOC109357016 [Lupinus angustifolius]OIW05510.1 hypothetical protein TanjilG_27640 [Lupinus angustifolius]